MAKKKKKTLFFRTHTVPGQNFATLGESYIKRTGVLVVNFEKNPGTKILFCEHGLKCFSPFRGTNSRTLL